MHVSNLICAQTAFFFFLLLLHALTPPSQTLWTVNYFYETKDPFPTIQARLEIVRRLEAWLFMCRCLSSHANVNVCLCLCVLAVFLRNLIMCVCVYV